MQILWWGFIFIVALLQLSDIRMSDETLYNKLNGSGDSVKIGYYQYKDYRIRYAEVGNYDHPLVIFVHGAPGSLDAFNGFLNDPELRKKYHMISVDRPGYGYSGFGRSMTSIREQAEALLPLVSLNRNPDKPLLVGHSYGGPIVAKMAMLAPDKIGALEIVGGAVDPDHEKIYWINHILNLRVFRWLMPVSMRVANDEKITHVSELRKMMSDWKNIDIPVTIIHGTTDSLVPLKNAFFAQKMLVNAQVTMKIFKNTGHLIPWMAPGDMKQDILNFPAVNTPIASGPQQNP